MRRAACGVEKMNGRLKAQGRRAQGLLLSVAVMQVMQVVQVMQVMQVFYNEAFDHVKRFNYN